MGPTRFLLRKPVIAAIAGPAVAGGLELACWCDLRVVEEGSVLGVFCRRWGVPLIDGGTFRLPRLIGASRAMEDEPSGWDGRLHSRRLLPQSMHERGLAAAVEASDDQLELGAHQRGYQRLDGRRRVPSQGRAHGSELQVTGKKWHTGRACGQRFITTGLYCVLFFFDHVALYRG